MKDKEFKKLLGKRKTTRKELKMQKKFYKLSGGKTIWREGD